MNTLNKSNLTELKSFGSPPGVVINVTAAVMVLLAQNGKIPKDRSWKAGKVRIVTRAKFRKRAKDAPKNLKLIVCYLLVNHLMIFCNKK